MSSSFMNSAIEESGVVRLIDPNKINVNPNQINAIPDYEDMHILAELSARRRGRTILMSSGGVADTRTDDTINVNLMGVNQDKNNPNFGAFSTEWHDADLGGKMGQTETFGITNITIKTNASFVPQISIEFTDIRGYSFFNNDESPYRILFDFPPPLFNLTVKGYYGKTLTYLLHLIKYTSNFNSDTGNFVINAEFVGITYAPLADVLFRYIINFPLLDSGYENYNIEPGTVPENTYDLIIKLKSLYHRIEQMKDTEISSRMHETATKYLSEVNAVINRLNRYKDSTSLTKHGTPILFLINDDEILGDNNRDLSKYKKIQNFKEYDSYLNAYRGTVPKKIKQRLCLGFLEASQNLTNLDIYSRTHAKYKKIFSDFLKNVQDENIRIAGDFDIRNIVNTSYSIRENKETDTKYSYIYADLSKIYIEIYNKRGRFENQRREAADEMNTKINQMIHTHLGMNPTIYNVFELILNDVDTFFKFLWDTSKHAEEKHNNELINLIGGDRRYRDTTDKIYPFPLIIKDESISGTNQSKEVRSSPTFIEIDHSYSFPEMELVDGFIETFKNQMRARDLFLKRMEQGPDGQNVWIPLNPLDSQLLSEMESPYFNMLRRGPNIRNFLYQTVLKRFYILTQQIYSLRTIQMQPELSNLYASSEASNLAQSLLDLDVAELIKEDARIYKNNINEFFNFLENNLPDIYDFGLIDGPDSFRFSQASNILIYKNKKIHDDYVGLTIFGGDVAIRDDDDFISGDGPVYDYLRNNTPQNFRRKIINWFKGPFNEVNSDDFINFTQQNLFYVSDIENTVMNGSEINTTRYVLNSLNDPMRGFGVPGRTQIFVRDGEVYHVFIPERGIYQAIGQKINVNGNNDLNLVRNYLLNHGNYGLVNLNVEKRTFKRKAEIEGPTDANIFQPLINGSFLIYLYRNNGNDELYEQLFNEENQNYDKLTTSIVLLSCYGTALSFFNNRFNDTLFSRPTIVEVPRFLIYYLGALSHLINTNRVDDFIEFLNSNTGKKLFEYDSTHEYYNSINNRTKLNNFLTNAERTIKSGGLRIVSDIFDVKNNLSKLDREILAKEYSFFIDFDYGRFFNDVKYLINKKIDDVLNNADYGDPNDPITFFEYFNNDNNNFSTIFLNTTKDLAKTQNLLIHSEIAVSNSPELKSFHVLPSYRSLNSILNPSDDLPNELREKHHILKTTFENYFKIFFNDLHNYIEEREKKINEDEDKFNKQIEDEDIRTQTYYSLKNINDKWLAGIDGVLDDVNRSGYPFANPDKEGTQKLINSFVFVDRTMSPIGDTIINPEILLELLNNPNTTIFTALSQILSLNGFEFFPLQNFMIHSQNAWRESFLLDTTGKAEHRPMFVCMYIGGTANYPTGIEKHSRGQFKEDGIIDLLNPGVGDFSETEKSEGADDDIQVERIKNFDWRRVNAFRVRFGEQSQSMFKDIKIEGNEFPETNESIQILSRIAGDNKMQAPIPKGQNLYNLYENRAYSSTITTLGNMMIQPSQYFQLENVPIFNGAYVILNVQHNIKPNHATTTFEGTKILKYPIPRVKEPYAIFGYEGGTSKIGDQYSTEINESIAIEDMEQPLEEKHYHRLGGYVPKKIINELIEVGSDYGITTGLRLAHFLSQTKHESAAFTRTVENLNYSESGLLETFPNYFTIENVGEYARQPQKIASRVYANRMGNGSEASQEGWKYRGRGYIQLTGRNNYDAFGKAMGRDFINNPDLVASDEYALLAGLWFFEVNNIHQISDGGRDYETIRKVTRNVNGGYNGLNQRVDDFIIFYNIIGTESEYMV